MSVQAEVYLACRNGPHFAQCHVRGKEVASGFGRKRRGALPGSERYFVVVMSVVNLIRLGCIALVVRAGYGRGVGGKAIAGNSGDVAFLRSNSLSVACVFRASKQCRGRAAVSCPGPDRSTPLVAGSRDCLCCRLSRKGSVRKRCGGPGLYACGLAARFGRYFAGCRNGFSFCMACIMAADPCSCNGSIAFCPDIGRHAPIVSVRIDGDLGSLCLVAAAALTGLGTDCRAGRSCSDCPIAPVVAECRNSLSLCVTADAAGKGLGTGLSAGRGRIHNAVVPSVSHRSECCCIFSILRRRGNCLVPAEGVVIIIVRCLGRLDAVEGRNCPVRNVLVCFDSCAVCVKPGDRKGLQLIGNSDRNVVVRHREGAVGRIIFDGNSVAAVGPGEHDTVKLVSGLRLQSKCYRSLFRSRSRSSRGSTISIGHCYGDRMSLRNIDVSAEVRPVRLVGRAEVDRDSSGMIRVDNVVSAGIRVPGPRIAIVVGSPGYLKFLILSKRRGKDVLLAGSSGIELELVGVVELPAGHRTDQIVGRFNCLAIIERFLTYRDRRREGGASVVIHNVFDLAVCERTGMRRIVLADIACSSRTIVFCPSPGDCPVVTGSRYHPAVFCNLVFAGRITEVLAADGAAPVSGVSALGAGSLVSFMCLKIVAKRRKIHCSGFCIRLIVIGGYCRVSLYADSLASGLHCSRVG